MEICALLCRSAINWFQRALFFNRNHPFILTEDICSICSINWDTRSFLCCSANHDE